ncbi:MAG TPA: hypothetical protein VK718_01395 [Ferruginibacter sp.]|jgi:hypothetical protein|nr:hypothetical protein [Ferruginibacter sp.]
MKKLFLIAILFSTSQLYAQELFLFTEPASNMAKGNIGVRLNNMLMENAATNSYKYHLIPEVMIGVSRKVMVHADAFISDETNKFIAEGGSVYAKYRFFSIDGIHSHFRMATYARYSFNNAPVHDAAINLYGHNSGYEAGIVATKLINKVALSASSYFSHALDNDQNKFLYGDGNRNAINYTLSVGKLMLPKAYITYKQTNLNLMVEILGQTNLQTGSSYLDIAPAAQLIVDSKMRFDLGYRYAVVSNLYRQETQGFLIRLEYNFFNVF